MSFKRTMLVITSCLMAIAVTFVLVKCSATNVAADPTIAGPPTIETYLQNIHAGMIFIKWMVGIVGGMFTALIGVVVYAYKRDIARLDKKAQVAIDLTAKLDTKYDGKVDNIEENFMSIETHKMICHKH